MKEFRKTEDGFFVCEECERIFKYRKGLSKHLSYTHKIELKIYYDNWLKEENEDLCIICGNKTEYLNFRYGYNNYCCKKHMNQIKIIKRKISCLEKYGDEKYNNPEKNKQTCLKKYNVENASQREDIKKQKEKTCLKNYGVKAGFADVKKRKQILKEKYGIENYNNIEQIKFTNLNKYGTICTLNTEENIKKKKETWIENYGVEHPSQSNEIKEKKKRTCLKNYGVEYPNQNINILEKAQKTALTLKQFRNTNIWYQGSYELDFLENFIVIFPDIQNGLTIKYIFEEKQHYYFPDFYIPSLNLIVECKNKWLAKRDKLKIEKKKKATIANGFNYIMIVDKDYTNLLKSISR